MSSARRGTGGTRGRVAGAVVASFAWSVAGVVSAAQVELRGTVQPMAVDRAVVERGGVRVTMPGGVTSVLAWDLVRGLQGAEFGTVGAEEASELLEIAEDLWRARSRVQRGDLPAARALFDRHFDRFRGTTSETALIVAEGTLRCRLASEDWLHALVPALEVARLRKAGESTDRFDALPEVIDQATLLCPQLAPTWRADARTESVARTVESLAFTDPSIEKLASVYVSLLRGVRPTVEVGKDDPLGVAFLDALARLRSADRTGQQQAVKDLTSLIRTAPEWTRAWSNYCIGRTALDSSDRTARVDGILALTRVAAQRDVPRRLAVESLELAVSALQSLGDAEGAAALERERARLLGVTPRLAPPPKPAPEPTPPDRSVTET